MHYWCGSRDHDQARVARSQPHATPLIRLEGRTDIGPTGVTRDLPRSIAIAERSVSRVVLRSKPHERFARACAQIGSVTATKW